VRLIETTHYEAHGLDEGAQTRLAALGDLLLGAEFNVTAVSTPEAIERMHFLDSLSLLALPEVRTARRIVDIGSGAGLPALVLALVLSADVLALESHRKKCDFIERAAREMELANLGVACARAEEYGRNEGREAHDCAVSRALAALPVVLEYSMPLLSPGGFVVAMKGAISDQERIQAERALGILGGDSLRAVKLQPFPDAEKRWAWIASKSRPTPRAYPRRPGVPAKRPLGA
jgi:16S rRNA (guanine527-N7)-methyltransferase